MILFVSGLCPPDPLGWRSHLLSTLEQGSHLLDTLRLHPCPCSFARQGLGPQGSGWLCPIPMVALCWVACLLLPCVGIVLLFQSEVTGQPSSHSLPGHCPNRFSLQWPGGQWWEGSPNDFWIAYGVSLPLSWTIGPGFCLDGWLTALSGDPLAIYFLDRLSHFFQYG